MPGCLPNLKNETVVVCGTGPSLADVAPEWLGGFYVVSCNSAIEYAPANIFCTAHSSLGGGLVRQWLIGGAYEMAFVLNDKKTGIGTYGDTDTRSAALRTLPRKVFEKIVWIDFTPEIVPQRFPFTPGTMTTGIAISGVFALEVAIRLGARQIAMVGFDGPAKDGFSRWCHIEGDTRNRLYFETPHIIPNAIKATFQDIRTNNVRVSYMGIDEDYDRFFRERAARLGHDYEADMARFVTP